MATQAERGAARERVSAYHESQLAGLLGHLGEETGRYRASETGAYAADERIHRYHRAAAQLWTFCFARGGSPHLELIAGILDRMTADAETIDWQERAAPRPNRAALPVQGAGVCHRPWPRLTTVERANRRYARNALFDLARWRRA